MTVLFLSGYEHDERCSLGRSGARWGEAVLVGAKRCAAACGRLRRAAEVKK